MTIFNTIHPKTHQRAFTLVELTVAILIGLMIATITLTLFNQQLASFNILRTQNFMVREAPQINTTLNKIIPSADSFLIYAKADDVKSGTPVTSGGKAIALRFDGSNIATTADSELSKSFSVISFDASKGDLNYYAGLSQLSAFDPTTTPSWKISTQVKNATFFLENGVLRITLTGKNDGEITYSASSL